MAIRKAAITLRQIRAFIAVAELGSFTRAAADLNLSQPALTSTIKLLEAHLGVELLLRTSRQVELTADGAAFLETVRPRLQGLDDSFGLFDKPQPSPQLSLACTTSIADTLIAEVLSRFLKTDDGISIDLVCGTSSHVAEHVRSGRVDFGLCAEISDPKLHCRNIMAEPFGVLVHASHRLAQSQSLDWSSFSDDTVLDLGFREIIDAGLSKNGVPLPRWSAQKYIIRNAKTLSRIVENTDGIAILPKLAVTKEDFGNFRFIRLEAPALERKLTLVSRSATFSGPVRSLLNYVLMDARRLDLRVLEPAPSPHKKAAWP